MTLNCPTAIAIAFAAGIARNTTRSTSTSAQTPPPSSFPFSLRKARCKPWANLSLAPLLHCRSWPGFSIVFLRWPRNSDCLMHERCISLVETNDVSPHCQSPHIRLLLQCPGYLSTQEQQPVEALNQFFPSPFRNQRQRQIHPPKTTLGVGLSVMAWFVLGD